uniref:Embigin n=1 Tax=Chelonoidis abingdonii TaxID=106734 RepID=A0A8C0IZT6_CHEAB
LNSLCSRCPAGYQLPAVQVSLLPLPCATPSLSLGAAPGSLLLAVQEMGLNFINISVKTLRANIVNFLYLFLVPQIEGKEHHVVSYVGDSVVLVCKSLKYIPINWIWYMGNGSDQVRFPFTDKYIVDEKYANITKLKILKISEKDDRSYWCQAVFKLGESKGKVSLKVLTYMTPLKPFLVIAAEVIILVAIIFLYEMYSKKKQMHAGTISFKSEDSNGVENSTTRHRKV